MAEPHVRVMTATPPLPCGRCGHNSLRLAVLVDTASSEAVGHQLICSVCDPATMAATRRATHPIPPQRQAPVALRRAKAS
jgi:hypothetical protein